MLALLPLLAASFAPSAMTGLSAVRQAAPAAKMLAGYATPFVYDGISQTADTTRYYSAGSRNSESLNHHDALPRRHERAAFRLLEPLT